MSDTRIFRSVEDMFDHYKLNPSSAHVATGNAIQYDSWRQGVSATNLQMDSASTGGAGLMPEGEVRKILREVIKEDEAVRNNKKIAPFDAKGLNVRTREYRQYRVTRNGHAVVYEGTGSDLGGNSLNTDYISGKVVPLVTSITTNWFEDQSNQSNLLNLKSMLREAAHETLQDMIHDLTFDASAYSYFHDITDVPFVAQPVLATTLGPGATGPVNAAAIQAVIDQKRRSSKHRHKVTLVQMGDDLMDTIKSQPYDSSGSTITTLEWLKKTNPGVKFESFWQLDADQFSNGRGRLIATNRNNKGGLYTRVAGAPRALPTIHRGIEKTIPIFILFGGVGCDKPLSTTMAEYNFG